MNDARVTVEALSQALGNYMEYFRTRTRQIHEGDSTVPGDVVLARMDVERNLSEAYKSMQDLLSAYDEEHERQKVPIRLCMCREDAASQDCPIHLIDHAYTDGSCCSGEEEAHRPMTQEEADASYPLLFSRHLTAPDGVRYLVDARGYTREGERTIGVSFTRLFPLEEGEEDDGDDAGLCFDFDANVLPALIDALQDLHRATQSSEVDVP